MRNNKDSRPLTKYMQLVAAHTTVSVDAISAVLQRLGDDREKHGFRSQPQQQVYNELVKDSFCYFVEENYLYAVEYADRIQQLDVGVVDYLRKEGWQELDSEIEDAWWMLMLRGLAWSMSILDGRGLDPPVPSSLYYNKTPVWIS